MRIHVYYGQMNLTEEMEFGFKLAVKGAVNWFLHSLYVKPIGEKWGLDRDVTKCARTYFLDDIHTHLYDTDFLLYIIADSEMNGISGYATVCYLDYETYQPVVGLMYFNGKEHEGQGNEQIYSTIVHEMMHALGFTSFLFDYFTKSNGEFYLPEELYVEESRRGKNVTKLGLPSVVEKARTGFGCETLNGVELEEGGGPGSAGSHWEKRVMYNDFMTADADVYDIIYSDITLAVFQDSGWYRVNYKYSNPITWGFHQGCAFLNDKCVSEAQALSSDFCTENRDNMCDYLGTRRGFCRLVTYNKPLPLPYRYFSNPYLGGDDYFFDFCPVVQPYSNGNCRDMREIYVNEERGEVRGANSRCLEGNYDLFLVEKKAGCYPVDCTGNQTVVIIGDLTVTCPAEGGDVAVPGYIGTLTCPVRSQLCRTLPCLNNCHGYGYCDQGSCVCQNGISDCATEFAEAVVLLLTAVYGLIY